MPRSRSALLLTPNGDVVEINLPPDDRSGLIVMYAVLRCDAVDCIRVTSSIDMWVDDEYLYTRPEEPNFYATAFLTQFGQVTQVIHGPVLITGGAGRQGETLPLTWDKLHAVLAKLQDSVERLRGMWPGV